MLLMPLFAAVGTAPQNNKRLVNEGQRPFEDEW